MSFLSSVFYSSAPFQLAKSIAAAWEPHGTRSRMATQEPPSVAGEEAKLSQVMGHFQWGEWEK
jgi:hypothetical protein